METPTKSTSAPLPCTPARSLFQQPGNLAGSCTRRSLGGSARKGPLPETPGGVSLMETPLRGQLAPTGGQPTGTPRRALIKQTERAIQHYLKDDCETNLPMIRTLEDISYQLWVESNTAFLDESIAWNSDEEEDWEWDEDCFYDSLPASTEQPTQECRASDSANTSATSYSSLGSSIKPCDETDCDLGYLASFEWEDSDHSVEIAPDCDSDLSGEIIPGCDSALSGEIIPGCDSNLSVKIISGCDVNNILDEWVVIGDDTQDLSLEHPAEQNRSVVSKEASTKPVDIYKRGGMRVRERQSSSSHEQLSSSLNYIENASDSICSEDSDSETDDDWMVLSMRVTEFCMRERRPRHEQSVDSGFRTSDSSRAVALPQCSNNAPVSGASGVLCLRGIIRTFVEYLLPFLYTSSVSETLSSCSETRGNSCECCPHGTINVLDVVSLLLTELYRS